MPLAYEEGRDFEPVSDPHLNFNFDHDGPPIRLTPASRIVEGERLLVDYYHGMSVHNGQVTACMSEPKVYEVMAEQAKRVQALLRRRSSCSAWTRSAPAALAMPARNAA